jgi:hypothetical protein
MTTKVELADGLANIRNGKCKTKTGNGTRGSDAAVRSTATRHWSAGVCPPAAMTASSTRLRRKAAPNGVAGV